MNNRTVQVCHYQEHYENTSRKTKVNQVKNWSSGYIMKKESIAQSIRASNLINVVEIIRKIEAHNMQ